MLPEARQLASLDAAESFGVKVSFMPAIAAGLGGWVGAGVSDREDKPAGFAAGALAGLGLYAGARGFGGKFFKGRTPAPAAPRTVQPYAQPRAAPAPTSAPAAKSTTPLATTLVPAAKHPTPLNTTLVPSAAAKPPVISAWEAEQFAKGQGSLVPHSGVASPAMSGSLTGKTGNYKEGALKAAADFGFGIGVPRTPFSVGMPSSSKERLPGMHRWVDRDVIERAYAGIDQGLDPADVIDDEAHAGVYKHPAVGAALGGLLAHTMFPGGGVPAKALGALVGGGAGALYHDFTAPMRQQDSAEALEGVMRDGSAQAPAAPTRKSVHHSASASTPMLVSSGGGEM